MLTGKGWFIWQVSRCENGNPQAIADKARATGCTHVLLKIAERTYSFGFDALRRDLVKPVVEALHARGLQAWGWHYVYGEKPKDEARIAITRTQELKLDGYVIDAEIEFTRPGMHRAAAQFTAELRKGLPNTPIALSSFRFPTNHPAFPWHAFLEGCDLTMPQVYWEKAHNSAEQLARSVREFNDTKLVGVVRPYVPTGAAYSAGSWRPKPREITEFWRKALELKLPAVNFYEWASAILPRQRELWDTVASLEWPNNETPMDVVPRWITAMNAGDLEAVLALYNQNAAHIVPGRTIVGQAALRAWYVEMLQRQMFNARFALLDSLTNKNFRRYEWLATLPNGQTFKGEDHIGLLNQRIEYHSTRFVQTGLN